MVWKGPERKEKTAYLTFDDGPIPEATPFVLDVLKKYNAKGTFFCVGENVVKHPDIYARILDEGHSVGNHTHRHRSGFKCSLQEYLEEVKDASEVIGSNLFRPPYGKLKRSQRKGLSAEYQVIMWDLLSGDFDHRMTPEKCKEIVLKKVEDRSIIVFHDSIKALPVLKGCLEDVVTELIGRGYGLESLCAHSFANRPEFKA